MNPEQTPNQPAWRWSPEPVETITLNREDSIRFAEALLAPSRPPTPRMVEALKLYRASVREVGVESKECFFGTASFRAEADKETVTEEGLEEPPTQYEEVTIEELGERYERLHRISKASGYGAKTPAGHFRLGLLYLAAGRFEVLDSGMRYRIPDWSDFAEKAIREKEAESAVTCKPAPPSQTGATGSHPPAPTDTGSHRSPGGMHPSPP